MTIPVASWRTSATPAVIVAESLRRMPDLLLGAPPPVAAPAQVAAAIARTLAPPVAPDPPPSWLLPRQRVIYGRALAAIRRFGAALVAEPVGSGKTWIGLALAARLGGRAVVIAPAILREQWERAAPRATVPLVFQTHEQWSRSSRAIPPGLVIIDESHRFRHATIRRYSNLAQALRGREGVLLTATPVVNRLEDAAHQLLLLARDDALAASGIGSLLRTLSQSEAPVQLGDLILSGSSAEGRPAEQIRQVPAGRDEDELAGAVLARLDRLRLSPDRAVRALLGGVLAAAYGSSPAALGAALARYRALLLQHGDAARAGRTVSRRELCRLLGLDLEQTVMWPLLDQESGMADLVPDDLPAVDDCLEWIRSQVPGDDPKARRLASVLADGRPTVVFTVARATVTHLRQVIGPGNRIGWCTGAGAGIGTMRLARPDVLRWFSPDQAVHELAPRVLISTDVAAEGLDLQRAMRIVNYDLPWTAVRLDQRAGRILRIGSAHPTAEIITLLPPAALEARLQLVRRLARKRPLPARLGVGPHADAVWRWRAELAPDWQHRPAARGTAVVTGEYDAALAGVALISGSTIVSQFALARVGPGPWRGDHRTIERLLLAARAAEATSDDGRAVLSVMSSLRREVRAAWLGAGGSLWRIRPLSSWARPALARLRGLAADAVRRRDQTALAFADRGISFLRRGHTAGERLLAVRLASESETTLPDLLAGLPPPDPLPSPIRPLITGLIVFRATGQKRRRAG